MTNTRHTHTHTHTVIVKYNNYAIKVFLYKTVISNLIVRGLLEKYPTFGREKETGLLGALDT